MTTTRTLPALGGIVTASQPGTGHTITGQVIGYCDAPLAGFVEVRHADHRGGHAVGCFHASRCEAVYTEQEEADAARLRAIFKDQPARRVALRLGPPPTPPARPGVRKDTAHGLMHVVSRPVEHARRHRRQARIVGRRHLGS